MKGRTIEQSGKKDVRAVLIITGTVLAMILCLQGIACSQEWHTGNETTIGWDAVTTLQNGDPIPAGSTVTYDVHLANAITDPDKENPVKITTVPIPTLEYTITLGTEGKFFVGLSANRVVDGDIVGVSEIKWSDDPSACEGGNTFGLMYFVPPAGPCGMRKP